MTKRQGIGVLARQVLCAPYSPWMTGRFKLERMFVGRSDILFRSVAAAIELTGKDMVLRDQDRMVGRRRGREAKAILCKANVEEQTTVRSSL
jgi:hypothetical protein